MTDLPEALPREEIMALFRLLRSLEPGSREHRETRERLILHNQRFAKWLERKTVPRTTADTDDLYQACMVGLIKAVDTFDPDAGHSWSQHARLNIMHELSAALRAAARQVYVPRDRHQEMMRAANDPNATPEQRAEVSRLAHAVSLDQKTMRNNNRTANTALNAFARGLIDGASSSRLGDHIVDEAPSPDEAAEETDATERLHAVVKSLPGLEAFIIAARLGLSTDDGEPRTLRAIAADMGIPESKASKLEARGFARLRHPSRSAGLDAYA